MYSPSSPQRKNGVSLFLSGKTTPRKPLLSPSSDLRPFSYNGNSSEALHLLENDSLVFNNGLIPISLPNTPKTKSNLRSHALLSGQSLSLGGGGSLGDRLGVGYIGARSEGKSMKEYDDTLRDLKKENFNLKLRIYFLEERLGGPSSGPNHKLEETNMEYKCTIESLKYDVREKSELLEEARLAIDGLESKISSMATEREVDKRCLEKKLKELEKDLSRDSMIDDSLNSSNPRKSLDSDEKLLREVELEMRRKIIIESPSSPSLDVVLEQEDNEAMALKLSELEEKVEHLTTTIQETENCLVKAQQNIYGRMQEISTLKSDIIDREQQIQSLSYELTSIKESSEKDKEYSKCLLEEKTALFSKLYQTEESLQNEIKTMEEKNLFIEELNGNLQFKDKEISFLNSKLKVCDEYISQLEEDNVFIKDKTPTEEEEKDYGESSIHTPAPCQKTEFVKDGLQIVTQSLIISPTSMSIVHEVEKLKRGNRKLRELLKSLLRNQNPFIFVKGAQEKSSNIEERPSTKLTGKSISNSYHKLSCLLKESESLKEKTRMSQRIEALDSWEDTLSGSENPIERNSSDFEKGPWSIITKDFLPQSYNSSYVESSQHSPSQYDPSNTRIGVSEEDDSWSEPDLTEARNRMGLFGQEDKERKWNMSQGTQLCEGSCYNDECSKFHRLMNQLNHEINLSNDIDSGITEDEDDDESDRNEEILICRICFDSTPKTVQGLLQSIKPLLRRSIVSLKHLRERICDEITEGRKLKNDIHYRDMQILQVNESLQRIQQMSTDTEKKLKEKILLIQSDVEGKMKDLSELYMKLNENYKMMAELSTENIRLSASNSKLEEHLKECQNEMSAKKRQFLNLESKSNYPPSDFLSSPDTSSSFDLYLSNSNKCYSIPPPTPPPQIKSVKLFSGRNKNSFRNKVSKQSSENEEESTKMISMSKRTHLYSDISSPDLGVDLDGSSDPFSSLERRLSGSKEDEAKLLHKYRIENEFLWANMIRTKGVMKDTLERLTNQSVNYKKEAFSSNRPLIGVGLRKGKMSRFISNDSSGNGSNNTLISSKK